MPEGEQLHGEHGATPNTKTLSAAGAGSCFSRARRGIDSALTAAGMHRHERGSNGCASCAALGLSAKPDTAPSLARDRVLRVTPTGNAVRVHDLTVAGEHEYFANDVLTGNCLVWLEEAAAMRYLAEVITHSKMGLRIGPRPHYVITTTPKPRAEIIKLWSAPKTLLTKGKTLDAYHLPPETRAELVEDYGGTTLGRQELEGEILTDMPGALLTRKQVDDSRVPEAPEFNLVVVAVDPANTGRGDLTGIVAAGRGAANGEAYVIADVSAKTTGRDAALRAWALFDEVGADVLVVEKNGPQEWLMQVMRDAFYETHDKDDLLPLKGVNVGQGKTLRAMPAAMRFQQNKAHIVGTMDGLEDEMCTWVQAENPDSPDRLDAMVHALAYIRGKETSRGRMQLPHHLGTLV